jgi:hypothetical protein
MIASLVLSASAQPQSPPIFATTKVEGTDNVYIFRYVRHQSMFIVTPAGVIATDPIGLRRPNRQRQGRQGHGLYSPNGPEHRRTGRPHGRRRRQHLCVLYQQVCRAKVREKVTIALVQLGKSMRLFAAVHESAFGTKRTCRSR